MKPIVIPETPEFQRLVHVSLCLVYLFYTTGFILIEKLYIIIYVRCYMNLWGVAVLELNCHPDHLILTRDQTTHLVLVHRPIL